MLKLLKFRKLTASSSPHTGEQIEHPAVAYNTVTETRRQKKGSFLLVGCTKVPGLSLVWYSDGTWVLSIPI